MKVAAHPMLVAVALGLLSPAALADIEDERDRREVRTGDEAEALTRAVESLDRGDGPDWARLTLEADDATEWAADPDLTLG